MPPAVPRIPLAMRAKIKIVGAILIVPIVKEKRRQQHAAPSAFQLRPDPDSTEDTIHKDDDSR